MQCNGRYIIDFSVFFSLSFLQNKISNVFSSKLLSKNEPVSIVLKHIWMIQRNLYQHQNYSGNKKVMFIINFQVLSRQSPQIPQQMEQFQVQPKIKIEEMPKENIKMKFQVEKMQPFKFFECFSKLRNEICDILLRKIKSGLNYLPVVVLNDANFQ